MSELESAADKNQGNDYAGGRSIYDQSHLGGNTVYQGGKTPGPGNVDSNYYPNSAWGGGMDYDKDEALLNIGSEHHSYLPTAGQGQGDDEMR